MSDLEQFDPAKASFLKQLEDLRPDLFYPELWDDNTRTEATATVTGADKVKTNMFAMIPMVCRAEECPYASTCPLMAKNIAPEKSPCPIEMAMVQQFFQDYVEELNVDTSRMVEVSMVRDLVDQEIQHTRKVKLLSQEHFIQENVVGIDRQGVPIMRQELHQAVEFEDKIHRRKEKLRSQLLATREARAKVGQASLDTAQAIASLLEQVQEHDRKKDQILREKLGIDKYQDDYIDAHEVD